PLGRPDTIRLAHPRADRGHPPRGIRPRDRRNTGAARRTRPISCDRRTGRGQRVLDEATHRLGASCGAVDLGVAAVDGLPGLPLTGVALDRHPTLVLADL